MTAALLESTIRSLPLIAKGKVRDNYAVGTDRLLMVATDRLSAFDVVMREPIPGKGEMLTRMALFWFGKLGHIVPNHLTGDDPESVVPPDEREQVRGRSMLVKRLKPLPSRRWCVVTWRAAAGRSISKDRPSAVWHCRQG